MARFTEKLYELMLSKKSTVSINGYTFMPLGLFDRLPEGSEALFQITEILQEAREELKLDDSFQNDIIVSNKGSMFSVKVVELDGKRYSALCINSALLPSVFWESELRATLLHEMEHARNGDLSSFVAASQLTRHGPKRPLFIEQFNEDPTVTTRRLLNLYRPRNALTKLDRYINHLEQVRDGLDGALRKCEGHSSLQRIMDMNLSEQENPSQEAVAAAVHDMQTTGELVQAIKETGLNNLSLPQSYNPFPKYESTALRITRQFDQKTERRIEEKLRLAAKMENDVRSLSTPLYLLGATLFWAEETRADRVSAVHSTVREKHFLAGKVTITEAPFEFADFSSRHYGDSPPTDTHPGSEYRRAELAQAAIGRYAEDLMQAGAPEQDAIEIATARVQQEAAEAKISLPSHLHPVSSAETNAARHNYNSHVERLGAGRQHNGHQQR